MSDTAQYRTHPAAEMFPPVEASEIKELAEDIRQNGLREPITLCDGMILDGRNRLAACAKTGVEPIFVELSPDESPAKYAWSKNYTRRHLSVSQRAMAATRMAELLTKEAKQRMARGGTMAVRQGVEIIPQSEKGRTRDKLAEIAHVSDRTIGDAQMIERDAPELVEEIRNGNLTISAAKRKIHPRKTAKMDDAKVEVLPDGDSERYEAMLTVVEVMIGAEDMGRRLEVLGSMHDAICSVQSDGHPWITIIRERYAQGVLQSHSASSVEMLPPGWGAMEPTTRIVSCMVTAVKVEPIATPGFKAKHDAWHTAIHRALEGVVGVASGNKAA